MNRKIHTTYRQFSPNLKILETILVLLAKAKPRTLVQAAAFSVGLTPPFQ